MNEIKHLYLSLRKKYGKPKGQWVLWCKRPKNKKEREQVIIEAILTQRVNWKNVEQALKNLKRANITSLVAISQLPTEKLASLIKPSGFYRAKSSYLKTLAKFILENYKNLKEMRKENPQDLREKFLKLKGIGPETADSILLYALDKPIFVIDEYTRRLVKRKRLVRNFSYSYLQRFFEKNLKKDYRLYQDFHALIVIDGKTQNKN